MILLTHDDRVRRKAEKYSQVDDGDEVEVEHGTIHTPTRMQIYQIHRYDVRAFGGPVFWIDPLFW